MTSPIRLRLSPELVADLETLAAIRGIGIDEFVARLPAEERPRLVAEDTARRLRTALADAYPIDVPDHVPVIPERALDTGAMSQ